MNSSNLQPDGIASLFPHERKGCCQFIYQFCGDWVEVRFEYQAENVALTKESQISLTRNGNAE
jgi:hypothetical protein